MLEEYKRALVTGGCGFIGSHLTRALLSLGKEVAVLDSCSSGSADNLAPGASLSRGDVRDLEVVKSATRDADVVFHLAANANGTRSVEDPKWDFEINALGTVNVLVAAMEAGVKRLVYVSSAAVYGTPQTFPVAETHPTEPFMPYGASKLAAEVQCMAYTRSYGLPVVIGRPQAVYGPGETAALALVEIGRYIRWHLNGMPVRIVGDPDLKTRDFVYVGDAARAFLILADRGEPGEAYNIGSGGEVTMRELVEIIGAATGRPTRIEAKQEITEDTYRLVADITKLKALGYEPQMELAEGVTLLAGDLGQNPELPGSNTIFTPEQRGESW